LEHWLIPSLWHARHAAFVSDDGTLASAANRCFMTSLKA
jgi:hypothetical protein